MAVTLQDIADDLQLSKATVSRSLRNDPLILPRTRAKVHETAARLGYEGRPREARGSSTASKAQTQQASPARETLGLLFPATNPDLARQDLNLMHLMQGVMTEAERVGKLLMVQTVLPNRRGLMEENPDEVPGMLREGACKALIIRGALPPADVEFLARDIPVISLGRIYQDSPVDAVVPDSVLGTHSLVDHLTELGHRRLAWVGARYEASFIDERQAGFVTGCLHNHLELDQQFFLGKEIYENHLIRDHEKLLDAVKGGVTAMVCGNDSIAAQVIEILEGAGLRVPQDVSITGFDAQSPPNFGRQITSIDPRFVELGRAAVRLATQRLNQSAAPPCIMTVRSQFVAGDTITVAKSS